MWHGERYADKALADARDLLARSDAFGLLGLLPTAAALLPACDLCACPPLAPRDEPPGAERRAAALGGQSIAGEEAALAELLGPTSTRAPPPPSRTRASPTKGC